MGIIRRIGIADVPAVCMHFQPVGIDEARWEKFLNEFRTWMMGNHFKYPIGGPDGVNAPAISRYVLGAPIITKEQQRAGIEGLLHEELKQARAELQKIIEDRRGFTISFTRDLGILECKFDEETLSLWQRSCVIA